MPRKRATLPAAQLDLGPLQSHDPLLDLGPLLEKAALILDSLGRPSTVLPTRRDTFQAWLQTTANANANAALHITQACHLVRFVILTAQDNCTISVNYVDTSSVTSGAYSGIIWRGTLTSLNAGIVQECNVPLKVGDLLYLTTLANSAKVGYFVFEIDT